MTSVPLATIQDEWSEFESKGNDKIKFNEIKSDTSHNNQINQITNQIENQIRNQVINDKTVNETIGQTKPNEKSKIKSANTESANLDEEEADDEFSAFEQQFKDSEDNEPKLKVESLEELVNTFDEKIVNCFLNYEEPVGVPVQCLNQDELINECQ